VTDTKLPPRRKSRVRPLFEGSEWNFDLIRKTYETMGEVALGELGLDIYPNQIEVITAEQMLDAYSSIGMPLMYRHWSFGKRFAHDEAFYKRGMRSLAYELVINSDPCINYIMEENSMTMQALVLAHAAYGHNHFFKTITSSGSGPSPTTSSITWSSPSATWPNAKSATARMPLKACSMPRTR